MMSTDAILFYLISLLNSGDSSLRQTFASLGMAAFGMTGSF